MKNKKSQPFVDTSHMTQFVADISTESVITILENLPRFQTKAVSSTVSLFTFEVRFTNALNKTPIYLSLQPWNKTETLITLSYNKPTNMISNMIILATFMIVAIMSVIGYGLFNSISGLVVVWGLTLGLLFYTRINGNTALDNNYTFDAKRLRTQEDLMGWIVADLQHSADLEIVEYSGQIERK